MSKYVEPSVRETAFNCPVNSIIILSKVEIRPRLERLIICLILFSTGLICIYGCRTTQVTGYWNKENIPFKLQHSSLVEKQRETDISDCLQQVSDSNPRFKGQKFELCMEEKGYVYELEVTKGGF